MIHIGDCVEVMAQMDSESVDAVVTDPPYNLGFMSKPWDIQHDHEPWARQALRILKPGGHLLAFGGTRTYHRLACAIEDAGFEIRDSLMWLYGSGFPKSLDVSKAIDKAAGAEREVVGPRRWDGRMPNGGALGQMNDDAWIAKTDNEIGGETAPATPEAQQWDGWGTALKPSHEPIVLARKPLTGTVSSNVLQFGTGALNIDGTRVGENGNGRWPSNLVLSHHEDCRQVGVRRVKGTGARNGGDLSNRVTALEGGERIRTDHDGYADLDGLETIEAWECVPGCPVRELDGQAPNAGGGGFNGKGGGFGRGAIYGDGNPDNARADGRIDANGGASRFFYTAKASRAERNAGLEGMDSRLLGFGNSAKKAAAEGCEYDQDHTIGLNRVSEVKNHHPTVKPIALMRWLCRLITPPNGTILDPFMGSGTTGCAASLEGFNFIGIEREPEYADIAKARIDFWQLHGEDGLRILAEREQADQRRQELIQAGQASLFDP